MLGAVSDGDRRAKASVTAPSPQIPASRQRLWWYFLSLLTARQRSESITAVPAYRGLDQTR